MWIPTTSTCSLKAYGELFGATLQAEIMPAKYDIHGSIKKRDYKGFLGLRKRDGGKNLRPREK
jgi:hypothetical protein